MLMEIPLCKWAGWAWDLTQVCLWKKILSYEERPFGLGCVCKLNSLEDVYRVHFTEQHRLVLRGWVFFFWIQPRSVTNYQQHWIHLLGCRGPAFETRRLQQETVQTLKKTPTTFLKIKSLLSTQRSHMYVGLTLL